MPGRMDFDSPGVKNKHFHLKFLAPVRLQTQNCECRAAP